MRLRRPATAFLGFCLPASAGIAGCDAVAGLGQFDQAVAASTSDAAAQSTDAANDPYGPSMAGSVGGSAQSGVSSTADAGTGVGGSTGGYGGASGYGGSAFGGTTGYAGVTAGYAATSGLGAASGYAGSSYSGTSGGGTAGYAAASGLGAASGNGASGSLGASGSGTSGSPGASGSGAGGSVAGSEGGGSGSAGASGASDAGLVYDEAGATGGGTWCSTHAGATTIDCHDFDEGQQPQAGFSSNYFSAVFASVTSSNFAPGSPPSALLISTPVLTTSSSAALEQFNDVFSFHGKVELTFALKIDNYDVNAGDVSLFRISYQNDAWSESLDFQERNANFIETVATAGGGTSRATHPAKQPANLGTWTVVDFLVDLSAHTMSLSYNGVSVVSNESIPNPVQNNPTLFVQVGLNYLQPPAQAMMIYYDNILLEAP